MRELTEEIVYLREQDGLTWPMIADRVGMTLSAVKSRYVRLIKKRKQALQESILVDGVFARDRSRSPEEVLEEAIKRQKGIFDLEDRKRTGQSIVIKPPCALADLSDFHFGDSMTDYVAIKEDTTIIRDTPGFYCGFSGDGINNWIVQKLAHLNRNQQITLDEEWELFFWWLTQLDEKLVYVCAGNHDNWTYKISGFDPLSKHLENTKVLYDRHQIVFDLVTGPVSRIVRVRHKEKYNTHLNPTHGQEVSWKRDQPFDISIGSHTHIGTLYRESIKHGKKIIHLLTGTYKRYDVFGTELGLALPHGRGCGSLVFDTDGEVQYFDSTKKAANYLNYLRDDVSV